MQTDKVSAEHKSLEEIRSQLQLVLLDFGLAEELTPRVRKHFISFLHMISAGNGRRAAHHMLLFSSKQECPRPEAFADDMEAMFNVEAQIDGPDGIDVDKVNQSAFCMSFAFFWDVLHVSKTACMSVRLPACQMASLIVAQGQSSRLMCRLTILLASYLFVCAMLRAT